MNHRTTLQLGLALLIASTGTAFAAPNAFVTKAMTGAATQVLLARQGAGKFQQPDMQTYTGVMVKDNTIISEQLTDVAKKLDIDLPPAPTKAAPAPAVAGKTAEASFALYQVKVTQDLASLYEAEVNSNDAPELKAFALAQLKDVQRHGKMAQRLSKTYKK
ncbi:DUF4142 domain-containing protein [Pseudomonas sp. App30]|uniref:DUF4142 domain-containing protein n=1 Tax=Pseudomonas sp. App30 TaxID=3068990 RepID=UPI003A8075EB